MSSMVLGETQELSGFVFFALKRNPAPVLGALALPREQALGLGEPSVGSQAVVIEACKPILGPVTLV